MRLATMARIAVRAAPETVPMLRGRELSFRGFESRKAETNPMTTESPTNTSRGLQSLPTSFKVRAKASLPGWGSAADGRAGPPRGMRWARRNRPTQTIPMSTSATPWV